MQGGYNSTNINKHLSPAQHTPALQATPSRSEELDYAFLFNALFGVTRKSDQNTASRVSKMTSKISLHIIHIFPYSLSYYS